MKIWTAYIVMTDCDVPRHGLGFHVVATTKRKAFQKLISAWNGSQWDEVYGNWEDLAVEPELRGKEPTEGVSWFWEMRRNARMAGFYVHCYELEI